MTKTFRPVFRLPDAAALDEEPAAALEVPGAADDDELEELEEQAASATATGIASASHDARLSFMSLYPFNSRVKGFSELGPPWAGPRAVKRRVFGSGPAPGPGGPGPVPTSGGASGRRSAGRRWRAAARR